MDSSRSQEPPDGGLGCKSDDPDSPMPSQETADLDWTAASSSHLEQVEYVEETPHEYGRASFASFGPSTPFSPQQSTSMDYEHRVSPLDPNMSSAARYSPVYSMSNSLAAPHSPPHALAMSNPSSPFPSSVGIPNPSSPISSTNNSVMPGSPIDYTGPSRQRSSMNHQRRIATPSTSYSAAVLRSPDSPIAGPSGILRQSFFHSDRLTPSPSPQSPLQAPMTPSDNFVSSSTGPTDDTNSALMADTSDLRYLAQTSDSNSILNAKVDSTREVATPLHDSHELDSSSPPGSYDSTPVDPRDGKSPDSQHVEVLIGYETIRIVEPDARFLASAADSYLSASDALDPLMVALKGRGPLVFSSDALSRAELLGLKGRGPLLLEAEPGSSSSSSNATPGLPLLLDSSIAGLKEDGLVLGDMATLGDGDHDVLDDESEEAVLETLKTRGTLEEQQLLAAQCAPHHSPTMDTDGNLNRQGMPCSPSPFCDDHAHIVDLEDDGLSQLTSHDVVLLHDRPDLGVEGKEQNQHSPYSDDMSSPLTGLDAPGLLRRSKRNQMKSDDDDDDDNATWCEDCFELYSGECPQHRVQTISDKPVPARAWASLPGAYLAISKLSKEPGFGVFARKTIPKRTQFGPLEGVVIKQEDFSVIEIDDSLELTIELDTGDFATLDTSSEYHSNWMRFVRPARCYTDMNLIISQQNGSLFYTTTRAILPRQELQVGYGIAYAAKRHLPVLEPTPGIEEDTENAWPCFECNELFSSSEALEKHLVNHDLEREVQEDKAKMKKSNRSLKRKVLSHLPIKKYKHMEENLSDGEEGVFHCGLCPRTFLRSSSFKRHLLQHTGENRGNCADVQLSHPFTRDRLKKAKKEDGDNDGKFSVYLKQKNSCGEEGAWLCPHCHLSFDTASMLNLHTLAHAVEDLEDQNFDDDDMDALSPNNSGDIQQCPQCSQQYSSKRELAEHTSAHGKAMLRKFRGVVNPAKPHKCELCYKSFATEDRLQRHMLVHGTEESKPLQCETCFKRFLNNSALACHVKIHTEEKKSFECPICRALFDQVMALKDHVHIHATDGMFTCPHCCKVFYGYSLIRKHIRAFHSERKHTCNSCGKLFPTLDKLRMHMLRHSDHREFLCANCGKQFKRKDKLKEHMKRMHSAEREAKLAQKPTRQSSSKKFIPKVSPTDYHRFIYKCHSCLLGFKRRGMLVNHLAKRHPDISPDTVPELNLPILKTTRDYYCQYCDKVYKSSSKRKAHILKNHPGLELPMSNRRKGGVPDIPGVPNPTFSQTVGSITTHPHGCPWCHKQYASKAKLLQHQRKKHSDLLPASAHSQQVSSSDVELDSSPPPSCRTVTRPSRGGGCSDSSSEGEVKFSTTGSKFLLSSQDGEQVDVIQLTGELASQVNILPGTAGTVEYQITTEQELQDLQDSGIIIDATTLKRPIKGCGEGSDMLSQAMSELSQSLAEFRAGGPEGQEHFVKILHNGQIVVTQADHITGQRLEDNASEGLTVTSAQLEPSQLRQLLTNSYSLPPSPPPSNGSQQQSLAILPRGWAATFTSYTAR